ncbi:MAG: DUF2461 domain-containing protein [Planctomycetota bacterium]
MAKSSASPDPTPAFTGMPKGGLTFLRSLARNNNRAWFHEHKKRYQTQVRDPFAVFLDALSETPEARAVGYWGGSHTMFRVYRDVRFSKDKKPYQTHVSGLLTPTGEKEETGPIVYAHMDAKGGFCAAGMYALPTTRLKVLRQRVVDKPAEAKKLVAALGKAGLEIDPSGSLKRMPRGFEAHAEHEHAGLLRLRHWIVREPVSAEQWTSGAVLIDVARFIGRATPLLAFGKKALGRA